MAQRDGISPVKRQRRNVNASLGASRSAPKGNTPDKSRPKHHYNEKGELILGLTSEASDSENAEDLARLRRSFHRSSNNDRVPARKSATESNTALVPYDSSRETSTEPPLDDVANVRPAESTTSAEPSTPPQSGWGLGSILKSARTVTRFFPSLGRSRHVLAPVAPTTIATSHVAPRKDSISDTDAVSRSPIRASQTVGIPSYDGGTDLAPATSEARHHSHNDGILESSSPLFHTDSNSLYISRPNTSVTQETRRNTGPQDTAPHYTKSEVQRDPRREEHFQAEATNAQSVGSKRKRASSPKTIPNPPGAYGMVDKFFDDSSSDEGADSDEQAPTTPTPRANTSSNYSHSRKKSRIEAQGDEPPAVRANFSRSPIAAVKNPNDRGHLDPKNPNVRILDGDIRIDANFTGMVNPGQPNSFKVPGWDTDDSSIDDDEDDVTLTPSSAQITNVPSLNRREAETPAVSNVFAASIDRMAQSADGSSVSNDAPVASKSSPNKQANTWSQPPPPPPNPSHATLPAAGGPANSERLSAARAKALQHAPKKPSTLRESSRISSSPAAPPVDEVEEVRNAPSQGMVRGRRPLGEVSTDYLVTAFNKSNSLQASSSSINAQATPQSSHVSSKSVSINPRFASHLTKILTPYQDLANARGYVYTADRIQPDEVSLYPFIPHPFLTRRIL